MIIRPRINDYYGIPLLQDDVDFAIPFLDKDIPLYVDPFLMWKSPSQMDNGLHACIVDSFNQLGYLVNHNREDEATDILVQASECDAAGLGNSKSRKGHRFGPQKANMILELFKSVPHIKENGFAHIETVQLLVDNIAKDRISDITCNLISSYLVDYTQQSCEQTKIPMNKVHFESVYDIKKHIFKTEDTFLPINPESKTPIIFIPKRWLRFNHWISEDDYFSKYYTENVDKGIFFKDRIRVLEYNRDHFDFVKGYIEKKERTQNDCKNDPLFAQIPLTSAKRKMSAIKKLPTGKENNADKDYERYTCQLLSSLLYPHLDFAEAQSRTDSGVLIRDLVFYNNQSIPFFKEIFEKYRSSQIVFEMKNVMEINRDHVNQLNRYLNDNMGRFGIFVTRNRPNSKIRKSLIDLWSGQRKCIIVLDDSDLQMMTDIFENKQRLPYEVLEKKYVEFIRTCPS